VIRLAQPVEWAAVDGLPVDLVLALAGPDEPGADNLKALALLSRTLRDRVLVEKLRGVNDAGALWALLAGQTRQAA
jgi:PTS system nitrogen regulatory IIA component